MIRSFRKYLLKVGYWIKLGGIEYLGSKCFTKYEDAGRLLAMCNKSLFIPDTGRDRMSWGGKADSVICQPLTRVYTYLITSCNTR